MLNLAYYAKDAEVVLHAYLDRFAELSKKLGPPQHILVADVHCQPDNVHEVALHDPHALQDTGSFTLGHGTALQQAVLSVRPSSGCNACMHTSAEPSVCQRTRDRHRLLTFSSGFRGTALLLLLPPPLPPFLSPFRRCFLVDSSSLQDTDIIAASTG